MVLKTFIKFFNKITSNPIFICVMGPVETLSYYYSLLIEIFFYFYVIL